MMQGSKVLQVENLSQDTTIGDLKVVFTCCGAITDIRIIEKEEKKMAFIDFKTKEGVETALSLSKIELKGHTLRLYDTKSSKDEA